MRVQVKIGPRFWDVVAVTILAAETYALRSKDPDAPASPWFRARMHLDSRAGRVVFVAGYAIFSGWFVPHLVRGARSTATLTLDS